MRQRKEVWAVDCPYCNEPYKPLVDSSKLGDYAHHHAVIEPYKNCPGGKHGAHINVTFIWHENGIMHSDDGYLIYITPCPRCGREL